MHFPYLSVFKILSWFPSIFQSANCCSCHCYCFRVSEWTNGFKCRDVFQSIAVFILIDAQMVTSSANDSLKDRASMMPSICIAMKVMCSCVGIHGYLIQKRMSQSTLTTYYMWGTSHIPCHQELMALKVLLHICFIHTSAVQVNE